MNFNLIATAALSISAALLVLTITLLFGKTIRQRLNIASCLTLWFVVVIAMGATGFLNRDEKIIRIAGFGTAVFLPVGFLCFFAFHSLQNRQRMREASLFSLLCVQILRVLGIFFVIQYSAHRLPAPFAPFAGWGDILIGAEALLLTFQLWPLYNRMRGTILVWNTLGMIDLITALTLGMLSAATPIRLFWQPPGITSMMTLPWIMIPCFLVPQFLFLHVVTFFRMKEFSPGLVAKSSSSSITAQAVAR